MSFLSLEVCAYRPGEGLGRKGATGVQILESRLSLSAQSFLDPGSREVWKGEVWPPQHMHWPRSEHIQVFLLVLGEQGVSTLGAPDNEEGLRQLLALHREAGI